MPELMLELYGKYRILRILEAPTVHFKSSQDATDLRDENPTPPAGSMGLRLPIRRATHEPFEVVHAILSEQHRKPRAMCGSSQTLLIGKQELGCC